MGLKKLDSEYKSHFKALPVHRPVLVNAKVLSHPSDDAPEVLESSRRAGLLSNQFSKVGEPALQRKRIVPYKYNHNIFPTSTVKELDDGQWIDSVGTDEESNRSHSQVQKGKQNMVQSKKEETEYNSQFANGPLENDSPVMVADKAGMKRASSNIKDQQKKPSSKTATEHSPERLPPAGRPTYISDPHDKRLLRPSDGLAYLTSPDDNPRNIETEYSERYEFASPINEKKTGFRDEKSSDIDKATYEKILLHRRNAYGLPTAPDTLCMRKPSSAGDRGFVAGKQSARKPRRNRKADVLKKENIVSDCSVRSCKQTVKESKKNEGHNSEETLPSERNRKSSFKQSCGRLSVESESIASIRSAKSSEEANNPGIERVKRIDEQRSVNGVKSKKIGKRMRERSRRSAWEEKLVPSISENNSVKSIYGNSGTRENVVERGRSPTPEMRHVGQSRRHHLDVTTGSSNPLASSVDLYGIRTLGKGLETQQKQRGSYDPSRYSDTGDSFSSSRTATTLTEPKSSDS